jgi:hypothetical protein
VPLPPLLPLQPTTITPTPASASMEYDSESSIDYKLLLCFLLIVTKIIINYYYINYYYCVQGI